VVRDNLRTLYEAAEHGFAAPLPGFVRAELERYVECGVLWPPTLGTEWPSKPEISTRVAALFTPSCAGRSLMGTPAHSAALSRLGGACSHSGSPRDFRPASVSAFCGECQTERSDGGQSSTATPC
jgi:hypothetical protein